jgi:hypothetical protein
MVYAASIRADVGFDILFNVISSPVYVLVNI